MSNKTISVRYINSLNETFTFDVSTHNPLSNLMEIIRDNDCEDWGDCLGRTWCRTCHVSLDIDTSHEIESEEAHALNLLSNRVKSSRLACQIEITEKLDGITLNYQGDF